MFQIIYSHIKHHLVELSGTVSGMCTGVMAINKGVLVAPSDLHAVVLAFFTGMLGGLGALVAKAVWNRIIKLKNHLKNN